MANPALSRRLNASLQQPFVSAGPLSRARAMRMTSDRRK
jgi:hypothetical protein